MTTPILYASIASRSLTAFWMMEELGIAYDWRETDIKARRHKTPEYLAINPSGRVPALELDGVVVTERPAICAILADRYAYGTLCPRLEDPLRGAYYRWLAYAGSVLDPALCEVMSRTTLAQRTWNALPEVAAELEAHLTGRDWLLGAMFSAADVMLGSIVAAAIFNGTLKAPPALAAYAARLQARPALQRAIARTFPPHVIAEAARAAGRHGPVAP